MKKYLIDTSVLTRLHQPAVLQRLQEIGTAQCSVTAVSLLELGYAMRSSGEYTTFFDQLRSTFTVVTASPWAQEHAMYLQSRLVTRGVHRSAGVVDLLIAATAFQLDATVLHYDRDFDTVASLYDQATEWVAPPGTLDGQASG